MWSRLSVFLKGSDVKCRQDLVKGGSGAYRPSPHCEHIPSVANMSTFYLDKLLPMFGHTGPRHFKIILHLDRPGWLIYFLSTIEQILSTVLQVVRKKLYRQILFNSQLLYICECGSVLYTKMRESDENWQRYGSVSDPEAGFYLLKPDIAMDYIDVPDSQPKSLPPSDILAIKKGSSLLSDGFGPSN
jgi:hypothetical protein